jgi:hypothetical protein
MWDEDIIVPLGFFLTVIVISIGIPLVRALARKWERQPVGAELAPEVAQRLTRMEQAMDAIAIEVERISEGQRFTTRLLAERAKEPAESAVALPNRDRR